MAQLPLRLPDAVHDVARIAAAAQRKSLNAWIVAAVQAALLRQATRQRDGTAVKAELERRG
jgi:hypothetical protein